MDNFVVTSLEDNSSEKLYHLVPRLLDVVFEEQQQQEDGVTEAEAPRPVLVNPDPEAQFQAELDNWAKGLQAQLTDVVANNANDVLDLVAIIDDPRWRVVTFRFRLPSPISMPPSPRL